jgi:D-arabinose 1-dehydrogenase-like Zn-dependent alcohol dehydrogenase
MIIINKLFSYSRKLFFEIISPKFSAIAFKDPINFLYVIFEKIAYHFEILYSYYLLLYDELIEKEIQMAKIKSDDSVLVIGSGSLPSTCILIARKTNAKIHGIDIDPKAVDKSTRFIKKLGLEKSISFELAEGINYDYNNFDVIFSLYGINDHNEILNILSKNINKNIRIVYRSVDQINEKNFDTNKALSDNFIIKDSINSDIIYLVKSFLLTKKN